MKMEILQDAEMLSGILGMSLDRAAWLALMIREQVDGTYDPDNWVDRPNFGPIRREASELWDMLDEWHRTPKTATETN